MGKLIIHHEKIQDPKAIAALCPFGALEVNDNKLEVNAACKMCKLCVKKSDGKITFAEDEIPKIDKSLWKDILVYVDHIDGAIHPVTFELIGKAKELAAKIGQRVCCLFIGDKISAAARELLHYGVDAVYLYQAECLKHFSIEPYTAVFEDYILHQKPCAILVGATTVGRQLAPRVAARFKTGLTADCTILEMNENTDLVQIRPAFGGNIMAQIQTPNHRPQMATVRYKVMNAPQRNEKPSGEIIPCNIDPDKLGSNIQVLSVTEKEKVETIENAEVLVVAGRGVKAKEDLSLLRELADHLGGDLAGTRPMVEAGYIDPKKQIGLSGRTVRPKLIITCGVSGAVQFTAGMDNSDYIFAICKDPKAPIFKIANYGLVGDLYEIVPALTEKIKKGKGVF